MIKVILGPYVFEIRVFKLVFFRIWQRLEDLKQILKLKAFKLKEAW